MPAGARGRDWVRLPVGHGHPGHVDQTAQGGARRRLEDGPHRAHPHQPPLDGGNRRIRREPRPGNHLTVPHTNYSLMVHTVGQRISATRRGRNRLP
jgi:hypothetical protein